MKKAHFYRHSIRYPVLLVFIVITFFTGWISGQSTIKIMPLGNSITYGNYHPEPRPAGLITGYRQALWHMLKDAGYHIDFVGNVVAGQDALPAFDPDNEGHPGWTDDQIAVNVYNWLKQTPADVIILHIGTNGLNPDPSDVEDILNEIDRYETNYGRHIKVIMAKIINRSTYSQLTTKFNFNIEKMAYDRIRTQGDDLTVIDMEFETGINYDLYTHGGEMYDNLHPYVGGHEKMAVRWFKILQEVLPRPDDKPYFTSTPNPVVMTGNTFHYEASAGGNPAPLFSMTESPVGMVLDEETGVLEWTAGNEGNFWVTLHAVNTNGADSQRFEVNVRADDYRVSEGLVALYDFREGSGNLVHDISGAGQPLDLYINYGGNVIWDTVQGLEITSEAILTASGNNPKIADNCKTTNEISIELWLRTGNAEQSGPAHILTVSDPLSTGVTLSQEYVYTDSVRYYFSRRLRTSSTNPDGTPVFASNERFSKMSLQHIVYTRDASGNERFYINGELAGMGAVTGTFTPWEGTYDLSLGNGFGFNNAWTGKLFLTALYNREITAGEVLQNYDAGYLHNADIDTDLPVKPGLLSSAALSSVAAKLTWESVEAKITGYVLERKEGQGLYHFLDMIPADQDEYVDAGLEANMTYAYRMKALNNYGESSYSNETNVKTFKNNYLSNVAYHKTANQSSTIYDGFASRAVDGNTNGSYYNESVTHTAYELNAWWQVDLGDVYNISYLEVWNRTDLCCKDRMARFYVIVSEVPFESYDLQTTLDQEGVWYEYHEHFPEPVVTFNVTRKGRYIRLQLSDSQEICLAELIAMGSQRLSPPVFTTQPVLETDEDVPYQYTFNASNPDGDSIVYSVPEKGSWLLFDPMLKKLSGTPSNSDTGLCHVVLNAYDGLYNTQQSFTIHVSNINDPPVILSEPKTELLEDDVYAYSISAFDPDGDPMQFSFTGLPSWLIFDPLTNALEGTPLNENVGSYHFSIVVSDGILEDEQNIQLTVVNLNDAPVVTSVPDTTILSGEPYEYLLTVFDEDVSDTLRYNVTIKPMWLNISDVGSGIVLAGVPGDGDKGSNTVNIVISDGHVSVNHDFIIRVDVTTLIDNVTDDRINLIYPNPAKDIVFVNTEDKGTVRFVIYKLNGEIIRDFLLENNDADIHLVSVTDLDSGSYIYNIVTDNEIITGILVIR